MSVVSFSSLISSEISFPSILGKVVTDGISEIDEEVICEEDDETREINERDELNDSDEIILNNDDSGDRTNDNDETFNQKQVRMSERIKKQWVNINPEDIGDNDNENDEDYKSWQGK